jgi:hypothetical protein
MADYIDLPITGGGAQDLSGLDDVSINLPSNDDILVYNSVSGKWENMPQGSSTYPTVATFADLPAAALHLNEIYVVEQSTGVWLINRHSKGFYISDGLNWLIMPEVEGYAPLAGATFTGAISATNLSGTNTGDETTSSIKTTLGQATATTDGWLDSTDFALFNGKPEYLMDLADVDDTITPLNNDRLLWDGTSSKAYWGKLPGVAEGDEYEVQFNHLDSMSASPNFRFKNGTLEVGQPTLVLPTNPINVGGTVDWYLQFNMQNLSDGVLASTDIVLTADNGNDTVNYVDIGINGSQYSLAGWEAYAPNDSYVFSAGEDIILGTSNAAKKIKFVTGGTGLANIAATLDEISGFNLSSGLRYKINNVNIPIASEVLPSSSFSGLSKITVGTTQPVGPSVGDLWCDIN